MPQLSEVNKFPHQDNYYPNFDERLMFAKETLDLAFPDFNGPGYWKVGAFIAANDRFVQALESFLYTEYNGAMLMLRNTIDAALLFAYCYNPGYERDRAEAMSYAPNAHYEEYANGKYWDWGANMKDSIDCLLGSQSLLGLKPTCQQEIKDIREKANFSAHLMERQIRALREFSEMTPEQRAATHNVKWTAGEGETKETITMTAKYLCYIRETYFQKFPRPSTYP